VTSYTVTVSESGSGTAEGGLLQVKVLTGSTEAGGASGGAYTTAAAAGTVSVTPSVSGSFIYWVIISSYGSNFTAAANNTLYNQVYDSGPGNQMAAGYYSGTVTSGTPVTVGVTESTGTLTAIAAYELPLAGWAVDASSPAVVTSPQSSAQTSLTTASFTPPGGSVLIAAMAGQNANSAAAITFGGSSSPSLTWTQRKIASTGSLWSNAVIYTATVPGGGGSTPSSADTAAGGDGSPVLIGVSDAWLH
jgi:hypothetical protein